MKPKVIIFRNLVQFKTGNGGKADIVKIDGDSFVIRFKKLVLIEPKSPKRKFKDSDAQKLLRRPHSKWAILVTTIVLSRIAMELLESSIPHAVKLNKYKKQVKTLPENGETPEKDDKFQ